DCASVALSNETGLKRQRRSQTLPYAPVRCILLSDERAGPQGACKWMFLGPRAPPTTVRSLTAKTLGEPNLVALADLTEGGRHEPTNVLDDGGHGRRRHRRPHAPCSRRIAGQYSADPSEP